MPFKGLFRSSKDDKRSHRSFLKQRDEVIANIPPQSAPLPRKSNYNTTKPSPVAKEATIDYRQTRYYDSKDSIGSARSSSPDSETSSVDRNGSKSNNNYSDSGRDTPNSRSRQDAREKLEDSFVSNGSRDSSPYDENTHQSPYNGTIASSIANRNDTDTLSHDSASFHSTNDKDTLKIDPSSIAAYVNSRDDTSSVYENDYDTDASKDDYNSSKKRNDITQENTRDSDYSDYSNHKDSYNYYDDKKNSPINTGNANTPSSEQSPKTDRLNYSPKKSGSILLKSHQRNISTSSVPLKKDSSSLSLKRFLKKIVKDKSSLSQSSELFIKYGSVGKLLGTGASGSVSLVTSNVDGNIYAVKKFRPKLMVESETDYKTKVRNEYKIGKLLNHENLIFTKELIKDYPNKSRMSNNDAEFYIVMEYCPYDFFNLVMSGLMEANEVACYFKQIVNGVGFLHEHGLAHRDLKLDNCVVNDWGQLKLIDFGSAVQFKKDAIKNNTLDISQSNTTLDSRQSFILARGVVGSDPYLAPEVLEPTNFGYDPRLVDIWSIAIIFCCMTLKRFPWKIPKTSDPSFKSFLEPDDHLHGTLSDLSLSTKSSNSSVKGPRGPERLLRLLPPQSRSLIGSMLIIDPKRRYLIEDVLEDPFYNVIDHCHSINEDKYYVANNHKHNLITEDELIRINSEKEKEKERDRERRARNENR